ncbi:MAG: hypothetical protein K2V38_08365, partial [Gemmataceae bacterium]|nr:hypothetical protein [Gemmataceae bacterium]
MLRAIRVAVGAAVVLAGGALLAQPPKDAAPTEYFPHKVKSKWTYKVGDNVVEVVVVKEEKAGAETKYQFDTVIGKDTKTTEWYAVRPDGVYR